MEPRGWRRRALGALASTGALLSAWLLYLTFARGIVSRPAGGHIEYVSSTQLSHASTALYVLAIGASLLVSSHRMVKMFGAAVLSVIVWLHFRVQAAAGSMAPWRSNPA